MCIIYFDPIFSTGLSVYGSPSDSDDVEERRKSPSLDPSVVAAAFRGNFLDEKPAHKKGKHHSKWDVQDFKHKSSGKSETVERKSSSNSRKSRHSDSPKQSSGSKLNTSAHSMDKKENSKHKTSTSDKHSTSKHSSGRSGRKRSRSRERKSEKETSIHVEQAEGTSSGYTRIVSIKDSEPPPSFLEDHAPRSKQNDSRKSKERRHHSTDDEKKRREHHKETNDRIQNRDRSGSGSGSGGSRDQRDSRDHHSNKSSKFKSGRKYSNHSPSPPRGSKHSYRSRSRSPRHHKSSRYIYNSSLFQVFPSGFFLKCSAR